ncbi:MAG: hypothetical protein KGL35_15595 [Bradyrhizobium sp.]|nr:hypothetical protein [Bradyrhizobium sp.]
MVLKHVCGAVICSTLLAWDGACFATEYQPGDFFDLDLSKAVLSPKTLGPSTRFAPFPIEASTDPAKTTAQVQAAPKAAPKTTVAKNRMKVRVAHVRAEKPRGSARTRLARHHSNPLDAEAFDTRIQVWPCKSGGICNWQRQ